MGQVERTTRSDYPVFRTLTTRWMDNDIYGHMNNVVHYSLFDTAVNGWLIEQGLLNLADSETVFLVVETGCKYYAEMAFPDVVTAGIRISKRGNSAITYQVGLFRNEDLNAAAEGFFVHVHVNRSSHKPIPLSAPQRSALHALVYPTN